MTAPVKGHLRHVAISVDDPWETAAFYKEAFGLEEVSDVDGELAEGVFLTDGVVNIALLKFKSDEASQGTGKDFVGLHHIGFWVDDTRAAGEHVRDLGAKWVMGDPTKTDGYELKHSDLDGVVFDVGAQGWVGAQKTPGKPGNIAIPSPGRRLPQFDGRREAARRKLEARKREARKVAEPT